MTENAENLRVCNSYRAIIRHFLVRRLLKSVFFIACYFVADSCSGSLHIRLTAWEYRYACSNEVYGRFQAVLQVCAPIGVNHRLKICKFNILKDLVVETRKGVVGSGRSFHITF